MKLNPGDVVDGKYRIVRLLGEGGMGAVYEGENPRIHRRVAIKVLHAHTAKKTTSVQRFEQEAKAAGLIGSEHIVEVLDLGTLPSGESYMVMEFLEGETLEDRIKRHKRLSPHQATPLIMQLLEGLAAAHRAKIIHRDLKPDNVFILRQLAGKRDFVKVVDFGVSKFSELETEGMSMTSTGAVVGTPYYLSPEQARGVRQLDARSDLYSVGVVLYQAVTGRLPFHAETFNELVFKIALESPEPAEVVVPDLNPAFAAIIAKSMVREANGRFQSAEEFQAALEQWLEQNPDPAAGPVARGSGVSVAPAQAVRPGAEAGGAGGRAHGGTIPLPQMDPGAPASPFGATQAAGSAQGAGLYASAPAPGGSQSSAQLGVSQAGVTVAATPPKKTGAVVAVAAAIIVTVGGGAIAAYKIVTSGDARGQASAQGTTSASERIEAQGAPSTSTTQAAGQASSAGAAPSATPSASNAPSDATAAASGSPSGAPIAQPSAQPSTSAVPGVSATAPVAGAITGAKRPGPTSTGGATTKPTGRVIGGDL